MKAAEFRDLGVDELRQREKDSTISCSGCGSRSRWGSSRRPHKLQALRRDLARVKTVLREKETA